MNPIAEITHLLYRYGNLIDAGDFAGIGALLADAVVTDASGQLNIQGADAVREMYERTTRIYPDTGTPKTKHVITNPIVEVDEDRGVAQSTSHYTVLQSTELLSLQPIIAGHYEHRFDCKDGTWRIIEHRFFVDLVGDLSQHLLMELKAPEAR